MATTFGVARTARQRVSGGPRLVIMEEGGSGIVFSAPFAPRNVSYTGFEQQYSEISRPDRKPLLTRSGGSLRKISMDLFIGSADISESFNADLKALEDLSASVRPLVVEYDPRTRGRWRITSLSYDSEQRDQQDDKITRGNASIELTEAAPSNDVTLNTVVKYQNKRPKSVRPKQGQTMRQIAQTYYGTGDILIVQAIAKANGISNPKHIPPGKALRLP